MANPEHFETLRKGVVPWNEWRRSEPNIPPDLEGADLNGENLRYANLTAANLRNAKLRKVDLRSAILTNADLQGADLQRAYLRSALLEHVNLSHANIRGTDLNRAQLVGANLRDTALLGPNFRGANLSKADLTGARLFEAVFGNTNLRGAMLDSCKHLGPSTIDLRTIQLSGGVLPRAFLEGCGLADTFIEYIPSLLHQPVQHHSCFISYCSRDQAFAERLHADLRAENLRCWFAPEDLKIGDDFPRRIEEVILLFDKVMIVLSKASVQSRWVEREVNAAREREDRENRTVLFPIRIDDEVMNAPQPWAADIRRARQIGDFCQWEVHDCYQRAFRRLLRDLKAIDRTSEQPI